MVFRKRLRNWFATCLAWFQTEFGREPAESSVRERISKIYKYMAERKNLAD